MMSSGELKNSQVMLFVAGLSPGFVWSGTPVSWILLSLHYHCSRSAPFKCKCCRTLSLYLTSEQNCLKFSKGFKTSCQCSLCFVDEVCLKGHDGFAHFVLSDPSEIAGTAKSCVKVWLLDQDFHRWGQVFYNNCMDH